MEYIHHISWPISQTTSLRVLSERVRHNRAREREKGADLASQDKRSQLRPVDPVQTADHGETGGHPPTVAYVFGLFRPSIQPAILSLPLAQPSSQTVLIDQVQAAGNGQGADASEHLARMGLGTRTDAEPAIQVLALLDVGHCLVQIDQV